ASGSINQGKDYNMLKKIFTTVSAFGLLLILASACAEQKDEAASALSSGKTTETAAPSATADGEVSIMDQPVNFSTPADVDKSIATVKEQAGEDAARELQNALGYILAYDLSIGHDEEKMYKKLNGRTPNEIISKMKR
ncbi:MAG TPA: hypothetical protein VIS57_03945, partial [Xanthomonadales bacterium]